MLRLWLLVVALLTAVVAPVTADPLDELRAGTAAYKEQRYQEAVDAFTKAIISGQLSVEALAVTFNNRGVAYGELGDVDRAILDYTEALGLRPGDPTSTRNLRVGYVRRGVVQAQRGDTDAAITDFTRAIELDPNHFLAYLRRGEARLALGQSEAALSDLEQAEALASDNAQVRAVLTRARAVHGAEPPRTAAAEPQAESPPVSELPSDQPEPATAGGDPELPVEPSMPPSGEPSPGAGPVPSTESPGSAPVGNTAAPAVEPERPATPPAPTSTTASQDGPRVRTVQGVNVRAGPGNDFERLTTVPGGTEAVVISEQRGWRQLRFSSGTEGWIYETWLEPADG
jgi:Flp pilus assembly protein TadD